MIKNLVKDSGFLILNNFAQLIVSLGSGIVIARFLGASGKGEVFLFIQIYTLVQLFFSFGFGPSIIFFLKKNEIKESSINYFIFLYSIFLLFLFGICILLFGDFILSLIGGEFNSGFLTLSFCIAITNILSTLVGYKKMVHENGIKLWSIVALVSNVIYLLILVILTIVFKLGVMGVAYSIFISSLIKLLILVFNKGISLEFTVLKINAFRKLSTYGIQIFLTNLFLTSVFRIDTFFLNRMVSTADLGVYSVSVNVSELLLLIPSAIGVALFPHLSGLIKTEQQEAMCLVGRVSFIIGMVGIFGLAVIGYPFILIVFGKSFLPAFIPFLYLLPGLMAMTLNYSYSNYFSSIGKPLVGGGVFLLGLIFNVGLNLWLIPKIGISGAAISSSIAYIIITLGFIVKIKQLDRLSIREFVFPKISDFLYIKEKLMFYINKR